MKDFANSKEQPSKALPIPNKTDGTRTRGKATDEAKSACSAKLATIASQLPLGSGFPVGTCASATDNPRAVAAESTLNIIDVRSPAIHDTHAGAQLWMDEFLHLQEQLLLIEQV
jgi:hypothetical protein